MAGVVSVDQTAFLAPLIPGGGHHADDEAEGAEVRK